MRLSISNLAWPRPQDEAVAELLHRLGVTGIELAPTKIWPRPLEASSSELHAYREFWRSRGIGIVALQALLYGRPDLSLFAGPAERRDLLEYLSGIARTAAALGARALVFGSPRNRRVGSLSSTEAERLSVDFFRALGVVARREGVVFCIEANPEAYGCDFITRAEQAGDLVETVADAGFGLHLDAGGMALSGEAIEPILERYGAVVHHFHISEPHLVPVQEGGAAHARFARALRAAHYSSWVSIEMKEPEDVPLLSALEKSLRCAVRTYGSEAATA